MAEPDIGATASIRSKSSSENAESEQNVMNHRKSFKQCRTLLDAFKQVKVLGLQDPTEEEVSALENESLDRSFVTMASLRKVSNRKGDWEKQSADSPFVQQKPHVRLVDIECEVQDASLDAPKCGVVASAKSSLKARFQHQLVKRGRASSDKMVVDDQRVELSKHVSLPEAPASPMCATADGDDASNVPSVHTADCVDDPSAASSLEATMPQDEDTSALETEDFRSAFIAQCEHEKSDPRGSRGSRNSCQRQSFSRASTASADEVAAAHQRMLEEQQRIDAGLEDVETTVSKSKMRMRMRRASGLSDEARRSVTAQ